jgi:hypothetical protein
MSLFIETTNGHQVATPSAYLPLEMLQDELSEALYLYWSIAEDILQESGVSLLPASDDYFTLENNFFWPFFCTLTSGRKFPFPAEFFMPP